MKPDMDLAREILLKIEESPEATGTGGFDLKIEGRSAQEVSYHVMLLHKVGLIEALDLSDGEEISNRTPSCLTWTGHEFLDAYRQDTLWQKAKSFVLEKTGALGMEALRGAVPFVIQQGIQGG